jgi:hypothetical protein
VSLAAVIGRVDVEVERAPDPADRAARGREITDQALAGDALKWPASPLGGSPDAILRLDAMPLASTGKIDKLKLRGRDLPYS